jgi:hypothetical protein
MIKKTIIKRTVIKKTKIRKVKSKLVVKEMLITTIKEFVSIARGIVNVIMPKIKMITKQIESL